MDAWCVLGQVKTASLWPGAVDMKGGIAAARSRAHYLADHGASPGRCKGSISFLITGDEEHFGHGPSSCCNGRGRGEQFELRLGRTSNMKCSATASRSAAALESGTLFVDGVQGHVASGIALPIRCRIFRMIVSLE